MRVCAKNIFKFATTQADKKKNVPNFAFAKDIPADMPREHMNLFQSINSAIDVALGSDPTYLAIYSVQLFSVKMWNLEVCSDVQADF